MFQCPNCGGNVRFDVASQQLACDYCGTKIDPYSYESKTSDAQESNDPENYEVTVFTCPQCGGEILSTDDAAAGFCSFCGASTVLYSRISNEHRPNFIIPFQKTKEDCKQAYSAMMKKAIFAPKEFKDPQKIDSFRGIYMPYWAFYETQRGHFAIKGKKSHRRGDYIITDHYDLTGELDSYYKGLSYDASSSFADNISEAIAPYDVKGMKAFTPAFLSGFYADTANVGAEVYRSDAERLARDEVIAKLKEEREFRGFYLDDSSFQQIRSKTEAVDQAMFPVWFMSYRNGDRVAYATVNGQTGKAVADLPVDIRKFIGGSLLLAVPVFILLNLFLTLKPSTLLCWIGVLAVAAMIISSSMIRKIAAAENGEDDKGVLARTNQEKLNEVNRKNAIRISNKKKKKSWDGVMTMICTIAVIGIVVLGLASELEGFFGAGLIWLGALAAAGICFAVTKKQLESVPHKMGKRGMLAMLCGLVFGTAVTVFKPVSDLYYYGAAILLIATIIFMEKELIEQYNLMATRKLPQFDKQGGDDRA